MNDGVQAESAGLSAVEAEANVEGINYEAEASKDGWVEEEKFRGNPDDWVDAKTFVERGKNILPIVNSKNKRLESEVEELKEAVRMITKDREEVRKNEYERALADLKEERKEAMKSFDFDKAEELSDKIEDMKSKPIENKQEVDNNIKGWMDANKWYSEDEDMRMDADSFAIAFRQKNPNADGNQMLDHIKKRIMKMYPEKFETQKKRQPTVEGSGSESRKNNSGDDGYAALPEIAKNAFKQLVRFGAYEDTPAGRAKYAKQYND